MSFQESLIYHGSFCVTHSPAKSVSVSDPHLDWGHPEGRYVTALGIQHMTQDHSRAQNKGMVARCTKTKGSTVS